jgi:hypothetical protein
VNVIEQAEREYVDAVGADRPGEAWILSDRDVWYANPFYRGPAVPHPEDNQEQERMITPGPWETSSNGTDWDVCVAGAGDMIADLRGCDNAEANAKAIAALPQLAEALRLVVGLGCGSDAHMQKVIDRARAALTAAGVTP